MAGLVALVLLAFAGCGAKQNASVPESGQQAVNAPEVQKTPADSAAPDESKTDPEELVLPEGFPEEFPVYPGAVIWQSSVIIKGRYCVKWETPDVIEKVTAFYERELPKAGYNWEKSVQCREYQSFGEPGGDGRLTIISRNSPQFNKKLNGDTQIIFAN
ncbi:MAG: hypothetical protein AB1500_08300 [Bacillota bacterium]